MRFQPKLLIGLLLLTTLMHVACVSVIDCSPRKVLKVVNWNVLYGFNHNKAINQGADWLNEQAPDVVAFQELNGISEKQLIEIARKWDHVDAAMNKETGFPVGLTSKQPIEVIERASKGYHHGFLHCKTYGIHFFVVHFWPGKFHEADLILDRIKPLLTKNEKVIILGDFNGCSRRDETFQAFVKMRTIDYTFVDKVEVQRFVDIIHKHDPEAKISCPSPITIPRWSKDIEELKMKQYRIDFVFADELLAKDSISGTISRSEVLDMISDHYPVVVEFNTPKHDKPGEGDGK